jgi:hypothetical protein
MLLLLLLLLRDEDIGVRFMDALFLDRKGVASVFSLSTVVVDRTLLEGRGGISGNEERILLLEDCCCCC